jgi:hypothetical protein
MKFKLHTLIFIILSIFITSPSFPQPSGTRQLRGETRCWRASDLNLSLNQVKKLELIQQAFFRETQLLRAELFAKRLELREFLTNPNTKIESIRSKYLEVNEYQSALEEKTMEYLIKVRNLLTQEQLKIWCPEQEFPPFRRMMPGPMGPMHHKRPHFQEGPREE